MALVQRLKHTDKLAFTFQKQVYLYDEPEDGDENGHVTLATPPQLTGLTRTSRRSYTHARRHTCTPLRMALFVQ